MYFHAGKSLDGKRQKHNIRKSSRTRVEADLYVIGGPHG